MFESGFEALIPQSRSSASRSGAPTAPHASVRAQDSVFWNQASKPIRTSCLYEVLKHQRALHVRVLLFILTATVPARLLEIAKLPQGFLAGFVGCHAP